MSEDKGRGSSKWWIGLVVVGSVASLVAGLVFFTPLGLFVFIPLQMHSIRQVETRMQRPEIYREVATNLALYCQSVGLLQITNELGVCRLPQPIPQLGDPWGAFASNNALVEFGGGFYHFGYSLQLNQSESSQASNVWELSLDREGSPSRFLCAVALPITARISVSTFLKNSLAEYDSRLARTPRDLRLHQSKIALLLKYDRSQVRAACNNAIRALPEDWWPRLTLAFLNTGEGHLGEASSNLVAFVESKPSYSRYTYLAYFYEMTSRPDEAAAAVEKAISYPVVDLNDDLNNTECRGYSLGVCLYNAGKYSTVIKLCDALIPIQINGNYAKAVLSGLKAAALSAKSGGKPAFTPSEDVLGFNPYEDFDFQALVSP